VGNQSQFGVLKFLKLNIMIDKVLKAIEKNYHKLRLFLRKNKWEIVFSGNVKSRSGDGRLMLQVERLKNKYRVLAYSGGVSTEIYLSQLIATFPEVIEVLDKECIRYN
jgi:hypothetical protein